MQLQGHLDTASLLILSRKVRYGIHVALPGRLRDLGTLNCFLNQICPDHLSSTFWHLHHLKAHVDQAQIGYQSLGQDQHNLVPRQYLLCRSGLLCLVAHAEVNHQEHTLDNLEQDVRLLRVFLLRVLHMLQ